MRAADINTTYACNAKALLHRSTERREGHGGGARLGRRELLPVEYGWREATSSQHDLPVEDRRAHNRRARVDEVVAKTLLALKVQAIIVFGHGDKRVGVVMDRVADNAITETVRTGANSDELASEV